MNYVLNRLLTQMAPVLLLASILVTLTAYPGGFNTAHIRR